MVREIIAYTDKEFNKQLYPELHSRWKGILKRCYGAREENPSYEGCTMDSNWFSFREFVKWAKEKNISKISSKWHLDKDILISGNKIYGPDTCCFVPAEINYLFTKRRKNNTLPTGVFKKHRKYEVHDKINGVLKNYSFSDLSLAEAKAREIYVKKLRDRLEFYREFLEIEVIKALEKEICR